VAEAASLGDVGEQLLAAAGDQRVDVQVELVDQPGIDDGGGRGGAAVEDDVAPRWRLRSASAVQDPSSLKSNRSISSLSPATTPSRVVAMRRISFRIVVLLSRTTTAGGEIDKLRCKVLPYAERSVADDADVRNLGALRASPRTSPWDRSHAPYAR
jgi:hypothetical protein